MRERGWHQDSARMGARAARMETATVAEFAKDRIIR